MKSIHLMVIQLCCLMSGVVFGEERGILQIDFSMGANVSRVIATDDKGYLFDPTGETHTIPGYDWGVSANVWLSHFLGFTSGIHYQKYGCESDKIDVRFSDDQSVSSFKSHFDVSYITIPLNLKVGHVFNQRHQVSLNFGPAVSLLTESKLIWTVSNQSYDLSKRINPWEVGHEYPFVSFEKNDLKFLLGGEYFFKVGMNGIGVSAFCNRSLRDLLKEGPGGEAYLQAISALLVYRRYF